MVQTAEVKAERAKARRAEEKAERAERRRMNSVEPGHCPKEGCGEDCSDDMEDSEFGFGEIYGESDEFERRGQCQKCGTKFIECYSHASTHLEETYDDTAESDET